MSSIARLASFHRIPASCDGAPALDGTIRACELSTGESAAVTKRTLLRCSMAVAATGLLLVLLLVRAPGSTKGDRVSAAVPSAVRSGSSTASAVDPPDAPSHARLSVRRPPASVAELGVLTDRTEESLASVIDRASLAQHVTADLCGDPASCDAVRGTLNDGSQTTVQVLDASTWSLDQADVDGGARGLSAAERARVRKLSRVVIVHVTTPTGPGALALRAAIAATAVVAREVSGVVWDQLLARFESGRVFASHAVTDPLGSSAFRRDRVEVLYEPKGAGLVRVLTAGLSRWGAPDVEAAAVPEPVSARMAEVLLAVAEALADGVTTQPLMLSRSDLARARGEAYAPDVDLPAAIPVEVGVATTHPENGDPNDFMAHVVPPAGGGPMGYLDLAERFFGPVLATSPGEEVLRTRRERAQAALEAALERWQARKESGARVMVLLPFPIPGDAGVESMWLEVTKADGRTVTGRLIDDPLGATDMKRGDEVTRPRAQVEDLELRGGGP
jgi:hypothetical protein